MTRIHLLFALLLALCGTVAAVLLTAEPAGGHGVPHAEFHAMLQGSPTLASSRIVFLGWLFGVLQILIFVTCITLGISRFTAPRGDATEPPRARGWLYALFGAGSLLFLAIFTQVVRADRLAMVSGEVTYLGPFPSATSWMLFGLWAAPLLFSAAYIFGFSRWIVTDADLARFEAMVAAKQQEPDTHS